MRDQKFERSMFALLYRIGTGISLTDQSLSHRELPVGKKKMGKGDYLSHKVLPVLSKHIFMLDLLL